MADDIDTLHDEPGESPSDVLFSFRERAYDNAPAIDGRLVYRLLSDGKWYKSEPGAPVASAWLEAPTDDDLHKILALLARRVKRHEDQLDQARILILDLRDRVSALEGA